MEQEVIITLMQKMFVLTLEVSVPILMSGVIIGLAISIFQTVTQIQESTLTFVPKIIAGILTMIILLPWMLNIFIARVNEMFGYIPEMIK